MMGEGRLSSGASPVFPPVLGPISNTGTRIRMRVSNFIPVASGPLARFRRPHAGQFCLACALWILVRMPGVPGKEGAPYR